MPFPILGVDSDNGSEFINYHLLTWCEKRKITFTRSRPGTSNDGAHVEHKNWAIVRTVVGYHRYDTAPELVLLNTIWALQSNWPTTCARNTNSSPRCTPGRRCPRNTTERPAHDAVTDEDKAILAHTYHTINPAAVQPQI